MDINSAINDFYVKIEDFIKPRGFKIIKSKQLVTKKTSYGFNQIFFDMDKSFDFTYSNLCKLWIRNDKIQLLKGEIITKRAKPDKPTILSSITSYNRKIDRNDLQFELNRGNQINFENNESIDKWFGGFEKFMNEAGFSFFESFKSDEDFDKWFNQPLINGTYDFSKGMRWNDSVSGLVAAKLVNNPAYEEIYKIWCEQLPKYNEMKTLDELKKIKEYLDNNKIV